MRPSVCVCLDTRKMSTTGDNKNKYPIKIKVNYKVREGQKNRYVVRRYPTGMFCKKNELAKMEKHPTVILALAKAVDLYGKKLSITEFERLYTGSGNLEDIKSVFDYAIKKLREEERDGTADSYEQALHSFTVFKGDYISFESISVDWLKDYERWMRKERTIKVGRKPKDKVIPPRSFTTIGIYCRALRTIFNLAIDLKIISRDTFPFGVRKYVIPTGRRQTKKAFPREEKNLVLSHRSEDPGINKGLDFWAYQYFCDGCNMADVAYLKFKNIEGDFLSFDRKKTENTERDRQPVDVYINERMREVINRYGNKSLNPDDYVFPILRAGMSSKERKGTIKEFIKDINELLSRAQKEINKEGIKLTVSLTSGTARYTAATLLKRHGIDLSTIAKALGHGSESTTEHYTEEQRETQMMISKVLAL